MTSWIYINQSVAWALVGLLVGFFMARSTVVVVAVADAVQDEGEPMPLVQPAPADQPAPPVKRRPRFTANAVLGAVIVVLGVFTAVQSYVQGEATARLTSCQTAYANGFADALDARSTASAEAQDALDQLLTTVASITPTPDGRAAFKSALADYLGKRAEAKRAQADNPYPPAPRDVCKEE